MIYSFLVFFEKPFYCDEDYKQLSINIKQTIKCTDKLSLIGLPTITPLYNTIIQFLLLLSFIIFQAIALYQRYQIKQLHMNYIKGEIFLFILLFASFFDVLISIFTYKFAIIHFICRGLIIILLVRNLRLSWKNNILIFWNTKTIFFLILCNIIVFGIVGYILFGDDKAVINNEDYPFKDLATSFYSLFILLSTCNFPDVMLDTFDSSKLCVLYFAVYIILNLYIFFSLLKALFFSVYYDNFQKTTQQLDNDLFTEHNKDILKTEMVYDYLFTINREFQLTKGELNMLLTHLDINKKDIKFTEKTKALKQKRKEMEYSYMINLFSHKKVELIINCVNMLFILFLIKSLGENIFVLMFQLIWSVILLMELFIYIYYIPILTFIKTEFVRSLFHLVNFLHLICLICLIYYNYLNEEYLFDLLFEITKPFIIIKSIRIFVLLSTFHEFKMIFFTLQNMKKLFTILLLNLFSFYFLFSTCSMLLVGGNIQQNSFVEIEHIPNNYHHINFNDFGSSFVACFALTMINNLQIIAKSLSYNPDGSDNKMLKCYFAVFYLISTIMIINIFQTLILEMYLVLKAKKIFKRKKKKSKHYIKKIQNKNESNNSSEIISQTDVDSDEDESERKDFEYEYAEENDIKNADYNFNLSLSNIFNNSNNNNNEHII